MNRKRRIKSYWDLIRPYYDQLDVSTPPASVLAELASMPEPVVHLLAAHWCQDEVLNGGFIQLFANSSGVLAPEAGLGFQAIGLPQWATLVEQAISYFGPEYPRARDVRSSVLPSRPAGQKAAEWDPFHSLDGQFYALLKQDDAAWERAANEYARKSAVQTRGMSPDDDSTGHSFT